MDDKPITAPITIKAPEDAKQVSITVDFDTVSKEPVTTQRDQKKLVDEARDKPWRVLYEVTTALKEK